MYQVVINDQYCISDIDIGAICTDGRCYISDFEATNNKCKAKFFENKNMAQSIAEQIGGKVIEYIEKKNIQGKVKCDVNLDLDDVFEQMKRLKNEERKK